MAPLILAVPAVVGALALAALAARRPAVACALLALAIPLTAGIARGAVVPLLRVNEVLLLVVAAGAVLHVLLRPRPLAFTGLDLAVLAFCLTGVVVPWAVIVLTRAPAETNDWLVVVGPVQYLLVYLLFSRAAPSPGELRLFFHLCLLASIPVAAVALLQSLDVGGVRELVDTYYPTAPLPSWDPVYRPASLLGHYSAVGAFGLLNLLLALALAATRHPGFPRWWLAVVMGANLVSLVAAQTYAPIVVVPLGVAAVLLVARRLPWRPLLAATPVLAASAVALWPTIGARVAVQFPGASGSGLPETLQTRVDFWQEFFFPSLLRHGPWFGTGTLIPQDVPERLVNFVDNGYLWQLFRAGLAGLAVLAVMLAAVTGAAWAARRSGDVSHRVIGAACLGAVISLVLLDTTSEYLTFTAVSQEFWMLVGLLAGGAMAARAAAAPAAVELVPRRPPRRPGEALRRLAPEGVLVRSSIAVVVGFGLARALGFLFQVTSGRVLGPEAYGTLGYALAVANVASVLLTTAPLGLSRFLARSADTADREAYQVNWLAAVGLLLGFSAVITAAFAGDAGLAGWMLVGLLANLLGVTALETYREVQRGLGGYTLQSVFYVLANGLQLAAVLAAAALGVRSPALFLVFYGLSPVVALVVLLPVGRGVRLDLAALRVRRLLGILMFLRPVLLQAILWNVWFNADILLLQHTRPAAEVGTYTAAKTIANGFTLIAMAIAFVFAPRVARLLEQEVRGHVVRALALTAATTVPAAMLLALLAVPVTTGLYGGRYAAAALPLVVLLAGMLPYGLKVVLGGLWLGLGHPVVETASSGAGMVVTVGLGVWLIPALGPVGAAAAFGAGALAQLVVAGAVTAWAFGGGQPRMRHLADDRLDAPSLLSPALAARLRRSVVVLLGWPRRLLWGRRYGYVHRAPATAAIVPVEPPARPAPPGSPASDSVAVVGPGSGPVAAAAELLGLSPQVVGPRRALAAIDRALAERWPLVAVPAAALVALPEPVLRGLSAFVNRGGTLFVDGLGESSSDSLAALGARAGFRPPAVRRGFDGGHLLLSGRRSDFAQELAGTALQTACGPHVLEAPAGEDVLGVSVSRGGRAPAVVERRAGRGRVVLSTIADPPIGRLAEALASDRSGAAVAALLLLRSVYGAACWRAPAPLANFTIDDPALRRGMLGLPYDALAARAGEHGFHVTVATVPRELELAEEAVVRTLRDRSGLLSACYHGCDHAGYEFYRTGGSRLRYAVRPLDEQRRALRRAVDLGLRFAGRHGVELDRVMVFPHGVGPAALLPELRRLGFVASANYGDKYPLEAPVPPDPDLGLRPADLAWEGFPLLWRRGLADRGFLLDLVLGRPVLVFSHPRHLGGDLGPFVERAEAIERATRGRAVWGSLDEVARHAHLRRRDPASGWRVLMTGDEACLHNPGPEPLTCTVERPRLPPGAGLAVDGRLGPGGPVLRVEVPANGRTVVRVAGGATPALPPRGRCSIGPEPSPSPGTVYA